MNEQLLWNLLTVVGIAGAVVIGLGLKKLNDRLKAIDPQFQSPQLRFRYTAHEAQACMDILGQQGKGLFDRFCLLMCAMMAEALVLLVAATHNITAIAWLQYAMFGFSFAVWAAGSAETLLLRRAPACASVLSLVKWGAFALWTAGMFAGLFIRSTAL